MTASDIALKVAQRAGIPVGDGHQHDDGLRARHPGRHERLGRCCRWLAADVGLRHHRARGQVRLRAARARGRAPPPARRCRDEDPLVLRLGRRPAALPLRGHVRGAGQGGRGPRLGHRDQAGADRHRGPHAPSRASCPDVDPPTARRGVRRRPRYVSTDVPHRTQAEVDTAAAALAEEVAGVLRRVRGRRPRATPRCGPAPRSPSTASAPPSTASTRSPRRGTGSTRRRATPPSFTVTGVHDRSLLGLAGGGGPGDDARPPASWSPWSTTSRPGEARPRAADVPLAVRRLRQRLGPHRPAGRGQGPRRDGAARGRRRGARRLRAGRRPPPLRPRAASTTASTSPSRQGVPVSTAGPGRSTGARSSRARPPGRPAGRGRTHRGRQPRQRGRQGPPDPRRDRHQGHRPLRRHGAGRGLARASSSTPRRSTLELKGGRGHDHGDPGVTVDGGSGPVKVSSRIAARPQGRRAGLALGRPGEDQLASPDEGEQPCPQQPGSATRPVTPG